MTTHNESTKQDNVSRRELLKAIAATSGAIVASQVIPTRWAKPVIEAGVLPAHAQGSPDNGDTDVPLPSFRCLELQENVDVMLTLDVSGSVANETDAAIEALKQFVDGRDLTKDQIGVNTFDTDTLVFQELTTNESDLNNKINSIRSRDRKTSIAVGVLKATEELTSSRRNPNNQPVMIVISDGNANELTALTQEARDQAREAANRAKQRGIRIITIAIGDPSPLTPVRSTLLRDMASTDSDFYYVLDPFVLREMFRENCSSNRNSRKNNSKDSNDGNYEPVGEPGQ